MKKILVGILITCLFAVSIAAIHILNDKTGNKIFQTSAKTAYKVIDKSFTGYIFSPEGKLEKEVPIKIKGKQYSETAENRDYFTGTIQVEEEVINISSTKDKTAVISELDTGKFYLVTNPDPNIKLNTDGNIVNTTAVTISKDFTILYGYTPNMKKNYGQGALFKSYKDLKTPQDEYIQYMNEAAKRVKLYVSVMESAFGTENGGNKFITVKEETLEGLKDEKSKQEVLEGLKSLSQNLYWFDGVKDDKSLFEFDNNGKISKALDGTILSIKVEEFKGDEAEVDGTSWFGNLGAVTIKYKAVYKDGQWQLSVITTATS